MPVTAGMTEAEAKVLLKNMDLNLSIQIQPKSSDTVPKGQVITSSPSAGSPIKKGYSVILYVSSGKEIVPVTIPNFVTMTEENAKSLAETLGLTVTASTSEYSDEPIGTVIGQSIPVGGEAKTGDKITFTISKGPENTEIAIPNVIGANLNAAKKELESAGFTVEVQLEDGVVADEAVVKSYSPTGSAKKGSTITIYLGAPSQTPGSSDTPHDDNG